MVWLESEGLGYWDSSHRLNVGGLCGHCIGLTRFSCYGLENARFWIFEAKARPIWICRGFVGKEGLDIGDRSYMMCWDWF